MPTPDDLRQPPRAPRPVDPDARIARLTAVMDATFPDLIVGDEDPIDAACRFFAHVRALVDQGDLLLEDGS